MRFRRIEIKGIYSKPENYLETITFILLIDSLEINIQCRKDNIVGFGIIERNMKPNVRKQETIQ